MSSQCLANYYHRMGVSYRQPTFRYFSKGSRAPEIRENQMRFARDLVRAMMERDTEIIYIDETTFHLWQT